MRKTISLLTALVCAFVITGCGNTVGDIKLDAGQGAIYVQENGVVSYAVTEKFDKDYYSEDDLKKVIEDEIEEYNDSTLASVTSAVELNDFDVSDEKASVVMDFATEYDLTTYVVNYNKVDKKEFYVGSISGNRRCPVKGEFTSADGKKTLTGKEVKKLSNKIIIVNSKYQIQVDGEVLYTCNCTVDGDGIVTTTPSSEGLCYVVYK